MELFFVLLASHIVTDFSNDLIYLVGDYTI